MKFGEILSTVEHLDDGRQGPEASVLPVGRVAVIKHLTKSDLEKEEIPDGVFIMVLSVEARDRLLQMNLSWVLDLQETGFWLQVRSE